MKQLIIVVILAVVGVIGVSSLPRSATAEHLPTWPALLTCPDVDGGGRVGISDITAVVQRFGADYPGSDYMLLHDIVSDGHIRIPDITAVVARFGEVCPLIDTQVAQATLATMPYQDCGAALADGYGASQGVVWVPNMGLHISNFANMSGTFDLENPFGLVCTEKSTGPAGVPDKLVGLWYIIPTASTGELYGLCPNPAQCAATMQADDVMPVGFGTTNSDEDNPPTATGGAQAAWHVHPNLCVGATFLAELGEAPNAAWHDPNDPEHQCLDHMGGILLVPLYGWMMHLYNFVPNPEGRFMKWNVNPDFPRYLP